jgi:hypothetical protein
VRWARRTVLIALLSFTLGLFASAADGCPADDGNPTQRPPAPKVTKTWNPGPHVESWQPGPDDGVPIRKRGDVCSNEGATAQDKEGAPLKCKRNAGEAEGRWRNNG